MHRVTWEDSCSQYGWVDIEEARDSKPSIITTVGKILKKNKKKVVITASISSTGNCDAPMCIPRSCILKIEKI